MSNREYRVWLDQKPDAWDAPGFEIVTEDDVGEDDPDFDRVARWYGENRITEPGTAEVYVSSENCTTHADSFTLDIDITVDVSTYENPNLRAVFS